MRKPQKRVDTKIIPNGVSLGKGQISDESAGKVDGESEVSSEGGRDPSNGVHFTVSPFYCV